MRVRSSQHAFDFLRKRIRKDVEEFWVVSLTSDKSVIRSSLLFRGTVDECLVHPRDIFRFLVYTNASSFYVAHSHPSGHLLPSKEDLNFTEKLKGLAQMMSIPLLDHLIITESDYYSFLDNKRL